MDSVTLLQTNYASPAGAETAATSVGDDAAGGGAADSPPPQAAVTAPPRNGIAARNGYREEGVRRSGASRRPGVGEGRTYYVLILAVVMAVFWFNYVAGS